MSTFVFNTEGTVNIGPNAVTFDSLNAFQQGYFEAAARSYWDGLSEAERDRLDHFGPVGFSDFAPETVERALRDCERVQAKFPRFSNAEGFWRGRNADKGWTEDGFPPLTPALGEDKLLHLREAK